MPADPAATPIRSIVIVRPVGGAIVQKVGAPAREVITGYPSAKADPSAKDSKDSLSKSVTVVVRGVSVENQDSKSPSKDSPSEVAQSKKKQPKKVSESRVKMQGQLPALEKEQIVTRGGKHVFSKVTRSIYAAEHDGHEAEIFDPSPSSMPTQLLRSARDLVHSQPLT